MNRKKLQNINFMKQGDLKTRGVWDKNRSARNTA